MSVGGWRGPSYPGEPCSIGWDLIEMIEAYLRVPSGRDTGQPITLAEWQQEALVRFYAVDPRTGRWVYERLVMELVKGVGKSPTAAMVVFCELVGDVVFDGFDANGDPVGRPRHAPWVQIGAVAEDSTENTFSPLRGMLEDSPAIDEFGIDMGLTRIFVPSRKGRVEPVTASSGAREGQPITLAILDETALWRPSQGGKKLAEVLRGNVAKMGGRAVETTNAFEPGLGSVAEETARAAEKSKKILYIHWAAPDVKDPKDPAELRPALEEVYRPAPWAPLETIFEHCTAPDTDPVRVRRVFLNHRVAAEARLVSEELLAKIVLDPVELEDGSPLAVGFDGSLRGDATSIIGVHMLTGRAYVLGHWERNLGDPREWEVPRHEVVDTFANVFDRFRVARMKFDPSRWRDEMSLLQQEHTRDVVDRFPITQMSVVHASVEAVEEGFRAGTLTVDGGQPSEPLVSHLQASMISWVTVGRARLKRLVKPDDGRRIDAATALTYAQIARIEAQQRGWSPEVKAPPVPFLLMR